ncbi:hypothetical protein DEV91_104213 [Phyllobacterium brassicacearum]|nr:hypothetical protein DEV91_104213 [Phyllobacterium brassicacearum]
MRVFVLSVTSTLILIIIPSIKSITSFDSSSSVAVKPLGGGAGIGLRTAWKLREKLISTSVRSD